MKKKLLSILLLLAFVLQTPVYAGDADSEESSSAVESSLDEKTSVFSDYLCLMSMYAHPPKLDVFAEKTKEAYYYASIGDYKTASELFKTYTNELTEIADLHKTDYEMYSSRVSEHASLICEVYDFYCNVCLKCCALTLMSLGECLNCSQSPKEESCSESHHEEYLENIQTVHYVMSLIDYVCRYVTLSYTVGVLENINDSEALYSKIIDSFTHPYEEDAYDWYNESYLYLKDNFELDFDLNEISASVCAEQETDKNSVEYIEGMYKVGVDIPEGEYILIRSKDERYLSSVCVSSDGNKSDIITYDIFDTHHYITVKSGQYLEINGCTATSSNGKRILVEDLEKISQGTYKVGTDIPAGEYKLTEAPDAVIASVCIQNTSEADHDIISYNIVKNTSYITVKDGQYLVLSDCTASLVE